MKPSNKKKWLKVVEIVVVGAATWLVSYTEIPDFSVQLPTQTDCSCERSRGSDPTLQHRQLLLFLLKLSFQILAELQQKDKSKLSKAQQAFLLKLCFQVLAAPQKEPGKSNQDKVAGR